MDLAPGIRHRKVGWFCCCLLLLSAGLEVKSSSQNVSDSINTNASVSAEQADRDLKEVLDHQYNKGMEELMRKVNQVEDLFELSNDKDAIIVLGYAQMNTVDTSAHGVKTIAIPRLVMDSGTNMTYYDCRGLSVDRNQTDEIGYDYFLRKIIDSAVQIRIVLALDFTSMKPGASKELLLALVQQVDGLVYNLNTVKDAISLTVTDVSIDQSEESTKTSVVKFLHDCTEHLLKEFNDTKNKSRDLILAHNNHVTLLAIMSSNMCIVRGTFSLVKCGSSKFVKKNVGDFRDMMTDSARQVACDWRNEVIDKIERVDLLVDQKMESYLRELEKKEWNLITLSKILKKAREEYNRCTINRKTKLELLEAFAHSRKLGINKFTVRIRRLVSYSEKLVQFLPNCKTAGIQQRSLFFVQSTKSGKFLTEAVYYLDLLFDIYKSLSAYEVQSNRRLYNVRNLDDWGLESQLQGITVVKENWIQFLGLIENLTNVKFENESRSLSMSEERFASLNKVLDHTLKSQTTTTCTKNILKANGNFVFLTELIAKNTCKGIIHGVDIRSFHKVFIDSDVSYVLTSEKNTTSEGLILTSNSPWMSIIAPTWEIIGPRLFNFTSRAKVPVSFPKAKVGKNSKGKGVDGVPGRPGVSGPGVVLGIGQEFINGSLLTISMSGGPGGPGQEGGDGGVGKPKIYPILSVVPTTGKTYNPAVQNGTDIIKELNYSFESTLIINTISNVPNSTMYYYIIYTREGIGGSGGNGGVGGIGGNPGTLGMIQFSKEQPITISRVHGATGKPNVGGKGGPGGPDGGELIASYVVTGPSKGPHTYTFRWIIVDKLKTVDPPVGQVGEDDENDVNITLPNVTPLSFFSHIVNSYKTELRDALLAKTFQTNDQVELFYNLCNDSRIADILLPLHTTKSLFEDFKYLITNLDQLQKIFSVRPLYESMLANIRAYVKHPRGNETSNEFRYHQQYLYTDSLLLIHGLRREGRVVFDIREYIAIVFDNINDLQSSEKTLEKFLAANRYKASLLNKMTEANKYISSDLTPVLHSTINNIEAQISSLNASDFKQKEVIALLQSKSWLNLVKYCSGLCTVYAAAANSLIENKKKIYMFDAQTIPISSSAFDSLNEIMLAKGKELTSKIEHFLGEIKGYTSLNDLGVRLLNIKNDISKGNVQFSTLNKMYSEIEDLLRNEMNSQDQAVSIVAGKGLNAIIYGIELYKSTDDDQKRINTAITQVAPNIKEITQHEIDLTSLPIMSEFEKSLDTVKLVQTDFHVKTNIQAMRHSIYKLTIGINEQQSLMSTMELFESTMTIILTLTQKIKEYQERLEVNEHITRVFCPECAQLDWKKGPMGEELNKMHEMTQTLAIKIEYEDALRAFKQFRFPFAYSDMENIKTLTVLSTKNDLKNTVETATNSLQYILKNLDSDKVSLNKFQDTHVISYEFDTNNSFYVWTKEKNNKTLWEFLSGKEVNVYVDILDGFQRNAVKFSEIKLQFRTSIETEQTLLNEAMLHLSFDLVHLGDSHFRCADKFYEINSDSVNIFYSERTSNEELILENKIYTLLKKSDPILSPYASWRFRLQCISDKSGCNITDLSKYRGKVDMFMTGKGNYVSSDSEVCNDKLDEYYTEDFATAERFRIRIEAGKSNKVGQQ